MRALRFFWMMRLHASYGLVLLLAVVAIGSWTTRLNAEELDSSLGMLLFVQMFLASTGFATRARQGHFDPLLTENSRLTIVLAHCAASIAPGGAAWLLFAGQGYFVGSASAGSALHGDRLAAFLIVSLLAWTAGFLLPRGAAGVVWITVLVAVLVTRAEMIPVWTRGLAAPLTGGLHALAIAICPFLLIGIHPAVSPGAVPGAVGLALGTWAVGLRLARRFDVYLLDRA